MDAANFLVRGTPLEDESAPPYSCVIVGEAPGRDEHMNGRPFIGRAGRFLRAELRSLVSDHEGRKQVFLTNSFQLWPSCSHRVQTPDAAMVRSHRSLLQAEFTVCEPKTILALGRVALYAVTDNAAYLNKGKYPMHKLVGTKDPLGIRYAPAASLIPPTRPVEVISTYHPRYIQSQTQKRPDLHRDWQSHIRDWARCCS